jgi:hypothetical protein
MKKERATLCIASRIMTGNGFRSFGLFWLPYPTAGSLVLSVAVLILTSSAATRAEESIPTTFVVSSKTGDTAIKGDCEVKDPSGKVLSCTLTQLAIFPPEPLTNEDRLDLQLLEYGQNPTQEKLSELKSTLQNLIEESQRDLKENKTLVPSVSLEKLKQYRGMLQELETPSKASKELRTQLPFSKEQLAEMTKGLSATLADPSTSSRRRELNRQLLEALSSQDLAKYVKLMQAAQQRTCGSWLDTYTLVFHKIGAGKWLSNEGPQGLCRTVTIYELDAETKYGLLWTFTRKNIATGDSSNPLCQGAAAEDKNQPTIVYDWKNSSDFELPCDFIKWFGTGR